MAKPFGTARLQTGLLEFTGAITPAAISGTINNYAPTNNATATRWRISASVPATITGIALTGGNVDGRVLLLRNGGTQPITFANEGAGSSAINRCALPSAQDWVLGANGIISLIYDTDRWVLFGLGTNLLPATTITGQLTQSGGNFTAGGGAAVTLGDNTSSVAIQSQFGALGEVGGWFGDGADGTVVLGAGTTTLAHNMFYDNLTVPAGAVLNTNGWQVFVRTLLTLGGAISNNGGAGASGAAGGAGGAATNALAVLGGSGSGGNGGSGGTPPQAGNPSTLNPTSARAGVGGAGGAGAVAGGLGGTISGVSADANGTISDLLLARNGRLLNAFAAITGGAGGGGGSGNGASAGSGGGGGGGGGYVVVSARRITGAGTIEAKGGAGGVASPAGTNLGGGGGGGGGYVVCIISIGTVPTLVVTGGASGAGAGGGAAGSAGASGTTKTFVTTQ